jgi:hypothetical protein
MNIHRLVGQSAGGSEAATAAELQEEHLAESTMRRASF